MWRFDEHVKESCNYSIRDNDVDEKRAETVLQLNERSNEEQGIAPAILQQVFSKANMQDAYQRTIQPRTWIYTKPEITYKIRETLSTHLRYPDVRLEWKSCFGDVVWKLINPLEGSSYPLLRIQ